MQSGEQVMTRMKNWFVLAIIMLVAGRALYAQGNLQPGVERWVVKTSVPAHSKRRNVPLSELIVLPNPIEAEDAQFETSRIPTTVGARGLREGDIVTTKGWVHLVALEDDAKTHRDGDYHIQIRTTNEWADTCLVIEIPYSQFVSDKTLAKECDAARQFVRERLLNGNEPGQGGNKLQHAAYVTVKGQLFFDAPHLNGKPRGRRNMKSYTPWEIHPVISITFAKPPH